MPNSADLRAVARDLAPSGTLRASINLGNPVLAQGTPDAPSGVTVDLAREVARRLGVPVSFVCFDAARASFEALRTGAVDICFLAIEPARAAEVAFTEPYVIIEGVYVVADDAALAGVRRRRPRRRADRRQGGVGLRPLPHSHTRDAHTSCEAPRGSTSSRSRGSRPAPESASRQRTSSPRGPDCALLEPAFMQIRQALGTSPQHDGATRRLPARDGRGAQGRRLRRGLARPLRPARRRRPDRDRAPPA